MQITPLCVSSSMNVAEEIHYLCYLYSIYINTYLFLTVPPCLSIISLFIRPFHVFILFPDLSPCETTPSAAHYSHSFLWVDCEQLHARSCKWGIHSTGKIRK